MRRAVVSLIGLAIALASFSSLAGYWGRLCSASDVADPLCSAGIAISGANVGASVAGFAMGDGTSSFRIGLGSGYPGDVPSGWSVSGGLAHPPSTTTGTTLYGASGGPFTYATADAACAAHDAYLHSLDSAHTYTHVLVGTSCQEYVGGARDSADDMGTGSALSCPTGYSVSGGSCALTSEASVMKPSNGQCGVIRSGNTITMDSKDPDCSGSSSAAANLYATCASGACTAESGGTTLTVVIDPTTGATSILQAAPSSTAGLSAVDRVMVTPESGAAPLSVNGVVHSTVEGVGTLANPSASACGSVGQPACAATMTVNETGTPSGSGAQDSAKAALDAVTTSSLGISSFGGTSHSVLSGIPSVSGDDSCANPISYTVLGNTIVFDMCAIWSPLKPWFAWFLYAMTAVYMWRRVSGSTVRNPLQ